MHERALRYLAQEGTVELLSRSPAEIEVGHGQEVVPIPLDDDLSGYDGITLRVKGDGRSYQFRIQTDDRYDGVSYRAGFETVAGEWMMVSIPFPTFVPTFRGRRVPDAPALDSAKIRQIGFLIADIREGEFRLEVNWIAAHRTAPATAE